MKEMEIVIYIHCTPVSGLLDCELTGLKETVYGHADCHNLWVPYLGTCWRVCRSVDNNGVKTSNECYPETGSCRSTRKFY